MARAGRPDFRLLREQLNAAPASCLLSLYTRSNGVVQARRCSLGRCGSRVQRSHLRGVKDAFIVRFAHRLYPQINRRTSELLKKSPQWRREFKRMALRPLFRTPPETRFERLTAEMEKFVLAQFLIGPGRSLVVVLLCQRPIEAFPRRRGSG